MKKIFTILGNTFRLIVFTITVSIVAADALLILSLSLPPVGKIVFSIAFGSCYTKAASVALRIGKDTKILSLYKGKEKPFLLLGPIDLSESGNDFFFVNRKHVIRSCNEMCDGAWTRFFFWLFILCDFTNTDYLRTSSWDDVKSDPCGYIQFDEKTQTYCYFFHVDSKTVPVSFTVPAKFFTEDMDRAFVAQDLPD